MTHVLHRLGKKIEIGAACLAAITIATVAAQAQAQLVRPDPKAAAARIQELGNQAIRILRRTDIRLEQRERQFREILRDDFHLRAIGLLALGHHRKKATPEQMEEFYELFSEFVLVRYSKLLGGYTNEKFEVNSVRQSGKRDVAVHSRIVPQRGDVLEVDWIMRQFGEQPKIIDVRVESISMVISQRDEFNSVIQRGGFAALLQSLRAQVESLPAEGPA